MKALFLLVALSGCSNVTYLRPTPLDAPASREECDAKDRRAVGWMAAAGALGGTSLTGGVTTILLDNGVPRWAIGGVSLALSVMGSVAGYMATSSAQAYAKRCTVNTGGFVLPYETVPSPSP